MITKTSTHIYNWIALTIILATSLESMAQTPVISSIKRNNPLTQTTKQGNFQWKVSFSQPVLNVDTSDFVLGGGLASKTAIQSISAVNGSTYLVNASAASLSSDTLTLNIKGAGASGSNNIIRNNSVQNTGYTGSHGRISTNKDLGQSFTPTISGPLTQIVVKNQSNHSYSGPGTMELRSGNSMSGTVLATQAITTTGSHGEKTYTFSNPYSVTANTQYTFRIYLPGATTNSNIAYAAEVSNPYSGGQIFIPNAFPTADAYFKIFISSGTATPLATTAPSINEYFVVDYPDMVVKGNQVVIDNNDLSPNLVDGSNLGSIKLGDSLNQSFYIHNIGKSAFSVTSVSLSGNSSGNFFISQTPGSTVSVGDSTNFKIGYTRRSSYGNDEATITVRSNHAKDSVHVFKIKAGAAHAGLHFDGSNDHVYLGTDTAFNFKSAFTFETWLNPDNLNHHHTIASKFSSGSRSFALLLLSSGKLEYSLSMNGSTENYMGSSASIPTGTWTHVAVTYNGSQMRIYINGVLDNTKSQTGSIFNSPVPAYLGVRSNGSLNLHYEGKLDESRFWSKALSVSEINSRKNCQLSGSKPNLVAAYNYNQGKPGGNNSIDTTLSDVSGNSHSGSLRNFSLTSVNKSNYLAGTDSALQNCYLPVDITVAIDSNVSCFGAATGAATASITKGEGPFSIIWSTNDTTLTVSGILAGNHWVAVQDGQQKKDTAYFVITQPTALVASVTLDSNVSCNGLSNGAATASATGGTSGYSYAWSNSTSNASAAGLAANSYVVTVTDSKSCTDTASITINQPTALVASISLDSNVSCNGLSNGAATASATGGTAGYTYAWSNSTSNASASGLAASSYVVTLTDSKSCSDTASIAITQPTALVASIALDSNVSCNGLSNGAATASATGGTAGYTYAWSNSTSNASASGLAASSYVVTVTDSKSCSDTVSIAITQPTALVASISLDSNVSCNGLSNGAATASATGGTAGYTYAWSNSTSNASATGLAANSYVVTVTDSKSCSDTASIAITQPTALVASISLDSNVSCNGLSNGAATASAIGGTTSYSYAWSNSTSNASASGLVANSYVVTVTDSKSCSDTASIAITQPTALVASISLDSNVSCNGLSNGAATASATGGTAGYTYAWSNSTSNASAISLAANSYVVTVTDSKSCSDTASIAITQPTALVASIALDSNVSCNGLSNGAATASATGGTAGYAYAWSNSTSNASATGLAANSYVVTVTDSKSCSDTASIAITQPSALVATVTATKHVTCNGLSNGSASVSGVGGTGKFSFLWNTSSTKSSISQLLAGSYSCRVTDSLGCTSSDTVVITQPKTLKVSVDSVFNPVCLSDITGYLGSAVGGGTAPIKFLWNTRDTVSTLAGLTVGNYSLTITDAQGCTDSLQAQLKQNDTIAPTVKVNNLTVYLNATGSVSLGLINVDAGSSDNCGIKVSTLSQTVFACSDTGTNKVILTLEDSSGNVARDTSFITVLDTITPIITNCISDTSICTTNSTGYIFNYQSFTGMDNCSFIITQTAGIGSGINHPLGTTTNTFVIVDPSGNKSTCTFDVTINSVPKPDLGPDVQICGNQEQQLSLKDTNWKVLWLPDSSVASKFIAPTQGSGQIVAWVLDTVTGCGAFDTVMVDYKAVCVGVEEQAKEGASITIYPNPNNGRFTIGINNLKEDASLNVMNVNGVVVHQQQVQSEGASQELEIEMNDLPSGTYYMTLKSGDSLRFKRLLIQR